MQDEYLDLVNEQDEVIDKQLRSEVYVKGLSNFRVVNLFLVNSEGKLWIPRRTSTKRIFPLCLDVSMGGHVESGETYEEAFKRETFEELAIDTDKITCKLLGYLTPHENNVSAFMKVYEIQTDTVPDFNPEDFIEYFWLSPEKLFEMIERGNKTKGDLPKLVDIFYPRNH
jgi:isopentenyl-diphosphate delta-isomerase